MSQHCRANPCCGDRPCSGIPLPQHASGLPSHNKSAESDAYHNRLTPAVPGEVRAQLDLIKHLAEYTTEKNWDDKRLYIMQAVDRALSVPLPEIEGGDGWQTMETAPKDGTNILAAFWLWNDPEKGRAMEVVSWDGEAWSSDAYPVYPPTHWMPLPAAPSASKEGETP